MPSVYCVELSRIVQILSFLINSPIVGHCLYPSYTLRNYHNLLAFDIITTLQSLWLYNSWYNLAYNSFTFHQYNFLHLSCYSQSPQLFWDQLLLFLLFSSSSSSSSLLFLKKLLLLLLCLNRRLSSLNVVFTPWCIYNNLGKSFACGAGDWVSFSLIYQFISTWRLQ